MMLIFIVSIFGLIGFPYFNYMFILVNRKEDEKGKELSITTRELGKNGIGIIDNHQKHLHR